jgi:NET1-associated nuclear protein 1 (U3 small nucleolar RNA-associated protein 17)
VRFSPHPSLHRSSPFFLNSYCFISSGAAVKIYSVATTQLLSTLSLSPLASTSSDSSIRRAKVTALFLNPSNPLQLIVGSLDGTIRLWDYTEGKLLRTLDMGSPVLHACGHSSLPDQLFVALAVAGSLEKQAKKGSKDDDERAGVYSISLRPKALSDSDSATAIDPTTPRTPARRMRLAQPRIVRSLAVSPSGAFLISVNPNTINICQTAHLHRGFAVHLDSPESLTTLAFHPTENYFATGNERGQIRLWYDVLENRDGEEATIKPASKKGAATALFHWHAHAVSSLAFTPNGAYLLSGGEEAVMVLWQLHTGHHEFVPRLGAPILTLSITDSVSNEQQVAARLRDGTVVFVGSQKLKISKTISGIKAGASRCVRCQGLQELTSPLQTPFASPISLTDHKSASRWPSNLSPSPSSFPPATRLLSSSTPPPKMPNSSNSKSPPRTASQAPALPQLNPLESNSSPSQPRPPFPVAGLARIGWRRSIPGPMDRLRRQGT